MAALFFAVDGLTQHNEADTTAGDGPYELTQVEYTVWRGQELPDSTLPWSSTTLPFAATAAGLLDGNPPLSESTVWFRFYLEKPATTDLVSLLFWRYNLTLSAYMNGEEIVYNGSRPNRMTTELNRPLLANISNSQWLPGPNEFLVRLNISQLGGNLAPVLIGPRAELEDIRAERHFRQVEINRMRLVFALSFGLLTFCFWLIRRQDDIYLWFSIMCANWALITSHMVIYFNSLPLNWWLPIVHISINLCIFSVYCFIGRLVQARNTRNEKLFLYWTIIAGIINLSLSPQWFWQVTYLMHMISVAVLASLMFRVALIALRKRQTVAIVITLAIFGQMLLFVINAFQMFFRSSEDLDITMVFASMGMPLLLLIFATVLLKGFTDAMQTIEMRNRELETKVEHSRLIIERGYEERRLLEIKQAAEQERVKIYRDLHDDVGSRLLSIIHADTDNKLGSMARSALESLRHAVSKANTRDQALNELMAGIREETELRLTGSGHQVTWTQNDLPDLAVPSDVAFNINRILKELVSNIIRHAHASEVDVRIIFDISQLTLIVSDNGCGMPDDARAHDGNGLNNIRSRSAEISASVSIISTPSEGTQTQINIPLPA